MGYCRDTHVCRSNASESAHSMPARRCLYPGATAARSRFLSNGSWTGTVEPGGIGPGSPAMDAQGRATSEWILDGLWLDCRSEQDPYAEGRKVLTWQARRIIGWDRAANECRPVWADTSGVPSSTAVPKPKCLNLTSSFN